MQSEIKLIADTLWKDDGISGSMDYTEQISRIIFVKYLDDYEQSKSLEAQLSGKTYDKILTDKYAWRSRAVPLKDDGKRDDINALWGADLIEFVNDDLFPYLASFKEQSSGVHSMHYKIGEIFTSISNKVESWHNLRKILNIVDELTFQSQDDIFEISKIYEDILFSMGSGGGNGGEFYTPRPVVQAMVDVINPQIGQTVYDAAAGSCGFLIEAYDHLRAQAKTTEDLNWLRHDAVFGNEKTSLAYTMGVMNMILHGIENPNITKKNTLTENIRDYEEKDRFDIILANPPFGGQENTSIQSNFPISSSATEILFLQHFMKKLKTWWKAAIIVPKWVLFNTNKSFQDVKQELLEEFDLHTIVSLPAGLFLPYAGVKTNILFFNKTRPTTDIRYYEIDPGRTLTKNKPLTSDEIAWFVERFANKKSTDDAWKVSVNDLHDYDLSAKNPNNIKEIIHRDPSDILKDIEMTNTEIANLTELLQQSLNIK